MATLVAVGRMRWKSEKLKPNFCATRSDSLKNGIESQDFGFGSGACAWSQG